MIEKVQFSDFNKFLVSTGYVLITIGLLLPYFYLRENYDLLIESSAILKYTAEAQNVICQKQSFALLIISAIPYMSGVCIVSGLILLYIGGKRWLERQRIEDQKINYEVAKLRTESQLVDREFEAKFGATKVSDAEKMESLVVEIEDKEPGISTEGVTLTAQTYYTVESLIIEKFKNAYSNNYDIFTNYKIKNVEFDLILTKRVLRSEELRFYKDIIVEIKFTAKEITIDYVIKAMESMVDKLQSYPHPTTNPIVFFVSGSKEIIDVNAIKTGIAARWSGKTLNKWRIVFKNLIDLQEMDIKLELKML